MQTLRTPDARFANLPDYPFAPHYVSIPPEDGTGDELRVHYVDEGDPGAPPSSSCTASRRGRSSTGT